MLNSPPAKLLSRSLYWLTRLAIVVLAVVSALIAMVIIALRYWILPDIGQYHDMITASFSNAIGSTVTIGKIESDWQGLQPHLGFTDVRILDKRRQPVLVLPRIDSNVSWMSLFTAELRLASLEINGPELLIRRDVQGRFFIGDVALSQNGGDNNLADWLLHQSRMVVRNALVVWVDEQRDAPALVLQKVNLHIESLFSRHRFALRALPPETLATPLDVRGDFRGTSFDDMSGWRGEIYTLLDYTDVTAWRPWLNLPGQFSRGRGALRGWLSVEGGKVSGVTADVVLYDVATKLAEDLPEMLVLNLSGRAAWHDVTGGLEISTRNLAMRFQNGVELQPTDFYFLATRASGQQPAGGMLRANLLQLDSLAKLAKYIPLEAGLRARLDEYAPRGKVSNLNVQWQGTPEKPDSYKLKGHFERLSVNRIGKIPGFSGLTVDVDGNEQGGRLNINSRQLIVDAPEVMREPLSFTTLTGQAGWKRKGGELSINVDNVAVANDDLTGNLYGRYQTQAGTLGVLDLTGKLTRGNVRRAARYTPLIALQKEGNDWLNGALLAGHTEDFSIRIKGNLSDFPPGGTKNVIFKISGHARDAVLEFARDWPRIENITGEFTISGNKLEVKSSSAIMAGARLQNVTVTLPDMMSKDLSLEIKGNAEAASAVFLEFIQHSPVRGYIDGFTDGITASGNGRLDLFARIPLMGVKPVQVSGNYRVQGGDIALGEAVPQLRNTRGVFSFTASGMQASGVSAEILGGSAKINIQTAKGGGVHATVHGRCDLDVLRETMSHPLLNYLHGGAEWDADISVANKSAQVIVKSDLRGIRSGLPQPFAKRADEVMPVRLEKSGGADGQDIITANLGKLLSARLVRREEGGAMVIKHGIIDLGERDLVEQGKPQGSRDRQEALRGKAGVWLQGSLPVLSVQGWEGLAGSVGESGPGIPIDGASLRIDKIDGSGMSIKSLRLDAAKRGEAMAVQMASSMLNGEVVWQPHGYEKGGKLSAHLRNLHWVEEDQPAILAKPEKFTLADKNEQAAVTQPSKLQPDDLPALEITIEDLQIKGKRIGHLDLVGNPDGKDWRLRRLRVTNPDGSLMGDGIWYRGSAPVTGESIAPGMPGGDLPAAGESAASGAGSGSPGPRKAEADLPQGGIERGGAKSQVSLVLEISDAGKILARSGYPNTVKGGSGKLVANLSWFGRPDEFNYSSLNGTLKLDTGKGRFVKMEPGAGKLLSILSLQSLPKRISLDFNDVFSEGFQFDNIAGNASIRNGVLDSQDFHIIGSSAKVTMKGSVDLNTETQNLRVRILPTLGDSVSMIGVLALGPTVGISTLILNKVLGDPLDKLVSFEYNVSGTWSDPSVVKVGGVQTKPNNILE